MSAGHAEGPRPSVGAGVSVLWGLVRIHVARAVESGASWRFDVVFGSLRQATASRSSPRLPKTSDQMYSLGP